LLDRFDVPAGLRPIGILGFGYRADDERPTGSWVARRRRALDEQVHRNGW
jgi:nitroreductase